MFPGQSVPVLWGFGKGPASRFFRWMWPVREADSCPVGTELFTVTTFQVILLSLLIGQFSSVAAGVSQRVPWHLLVVSNIAA